MTATAPKAIRIRDRTHMVMLFGHATNTGSYIASGHATLEGNSLKIKLASGHYYRIEVDGTLAHLQPFVGEPPKARPEPVRQEQRNPTRANKIRVRQLDRPASARIAVTEQVSIHSGANEECEDLTEEDLRRLRGEMPLTAKSRKKWQH